MSTLTFSIRRGPLRRRLSPRLPPQLSPRLPLLLLLPLLLVGCTGLTQYRRSLAPCVSADLEHDCRSSAIQQYRAVGADRPGYTLGIIEFDDQGQLFDRKQMTAVVDQISGEAAGTDDSLMVVFVHGWKHSAAPGDATHAGDDNLTSFRQVLLDLSKTEQALSVRQRRAPRKIAGVFIAWRGLSISAWGLKELTFWDRKSTAHQVGHGEVTEVLARLEQVRQTKDALSPSGHSGTRLIVVGHSFGGAVVYSAVGQILQDRFIQTKGPSGTASDIDGFGSLVVLINPAFEAIRFAPLSDLANERATYFDTQLPVLAIMTSEADWATDVAFPIGRWLSTRFEKNLEVTRLNPISGTPVTIDERQSNVKTVGHYEPYRTHYLHAKDQGAVPLQSPSKAAAAPSPASATQRAQTLAGASQGWEDDRPGSRIDFGGSWLERTPDSAGRNPYLVIKVDKTLIPNHNDIWDSRVLEFITQLILISSQDSNFDKRKGDRSAVSAP